jgi:hypothetical protein
MLQINASDEGGAIEVDFEHGSVDKRSAYPARLL